MERSFLVPDNPGGCDFPDTANQYEQSELSSLEPDAVLEWLTGSGPPVVPVVSFIPEKISGSEQPESIVYDNTYEEKHSVATVESDDGLHWLSSLENDSELDQQVAAASPFTQFNDAEHCATEEDTDIRKHNNAFPFHNQLPASEADRHFGNKESGNTTVGFISDILDGVVFTPVGASELPRPSPDTRCRSTLSSFRPAESEEANQQQHPHQPVKPSVSNKLELIKAIRTKSPPPADLETLFQRELAAKIKKRCLETQQREQEESSPVVSNPPTRSTQSALPPIPKLIEETTADVSIPLDHSLGEFDNPLYQTLDECYSETSSPPPPPPLPLDSYSEVSYAVIDDSSLLSHYQTVVSGALVNQSEEEERVYAQVADDISEDRTYDIAKSLTYDIAKSLTDTIGDAVYENLEEFQEQTYVNILEANDPQRCNNVLTALILDVDAAVASSSNSRSSNCSSSGNSSSPQQSSSSPEQLSPADSLANVSVGSVRSVGTPDSGVFGLLKPADYSQLPDHLMIEEKTNPGDQADLLDRTLKQFEQLEQMSTGIFESLPKQTANMDTSAVLLTQTEEKLDGSKELVSPVLLEATMEDHILPISEIPIAQLLEMAGSVVPCEENTANSSDEDVQHEPPKMPMSPPPIENPSVEPRLISTPAVTENPEDDLYLASLVSVDSQGSSMTASTNSADSLRSVRSPEPKTNIGAKIVEDQIKKMQELEHARNEKLGLEDIGDSYEKLSSSRYDVINQMTPKKAKRTMWLTSTTEEDSVDQESATPDVKSRPLDGAKPGGVNNESILVNKEETKAFWEGKMQSEVEDSLPATSGRNHRMKAEQQIQRQAALSPPPGFDNDMVDGHVAPSETELGEEPSLSSMDFIDVASITFKGDPESETESKPFVVFGSFDDSHIDAVEAEPSTTPLSVLAAPTTTASIQTEKPQRSRDIRPKPLYFEPDRASSSSDNEFEPDSPASFSSGRGAHGSHSNPTETLIEREIRLQREREEAVLRERQKALEILEATRKQTKAPEVAARKSPPVESNKKEGVKSPAPPVAVQLSSGDNNMIVKKTIQAEVKKSTEMLISPAEIRISEEIRELKRREEELRQLREANARNQLQLANEDPTSFMTTTSAGVTDDEGLYSDAERDVSSSEANSSRVESPEAGMIPNEYSKFPHQRTQSMDSMSSGHSSGDHVVAPMNNTAEAAKRGRANKVVMPLENLSDQEDTPAFLSELQETPIEREIRLGREREEALRREKGLQPQQGVAVSAIKQNEKETRKGHRIANGGSDQRDVQHRYATSIIQREMEEIAERENELVRAGKIQTTSVERADSKVSGLGDYSKKMTVSAAQVNNKTPVAVSHSQDPVPIRSESANSGRESPIEIQTKKAPHMKVAYANRGYGNVSGAPPAASATWRNFSNPQGPQRGLMEKFFMSRGRINSQTKFNNTTSSTTSPSSSSASHNITPGSSAGDSVGVIKPAVTPVRYLPPAVKPVELQAARRDQKEEEEYREKVVPPRRHYATTEEKIQQEFREMQKREEELKLNRSKFFAKSQPNLLDIDDGVSEPDQHMGSLRSAHSISDLLADESQSVEMREDSLPMSSSSTVKGARRKSALIAQWENRIHQQDF